jgi:hypothetical protein
MLSITYVIIALLILAIVIAAPPVLEYRLGDVYRGLLLYPHHRYLYIPLSYPLWSIARQYANTTSISHNIAVLDAIVPINPSCDRLVVHLRLGDVIEKHPRSVADFLSGSYAIDEEHLLTMEHDGMRVHGSDGATSEGYVKPLSYYVHVIDEYKRSDGCGAEVTIIGGTHRSIPMVKSLEYVSSIVSLFRQNGFVVNQRISMSPSVREADQDFIDMVNARYFVPSGGGFSQMAAQLACRRHARIWCDTDHTWVKSHEWD